MAEGGGLGSDAPGCRGGPDGLPLGWDKPLGTCDAATVMDGAEAATVVRGVTD